MPHPLLTSVHSPFNLLRLFKDDFHRNKTDFTIVQATHACNCFRIRISMHVCMNKHACVGLGHGCAIAAPLTVRVGQTFFSKERNVFSFQKNATFSHSFAFFLKRMLRSLRSFKFFIKERCVLCVLLCSL